MEKVTLQAFTPLTDPHAGNVDPNDENGGVFETDKANAAFYTKAQAAGPVGQSAASVQLEVAQQEIEARNEARKVSKAGRNLFRNLQIVPKAGMEGNVAVVDPMPKKYANVEPGDQRTNQQEAVQGPDTGVQGDGKKTSKKDEK